MKPYLTINQLCCLITVLAVLPCVVSGEPRKSVGKPCAAGRDPSQAGPLTLQHALGLAMKHNPGLQASGARKEAAQGRSQQAHTWQNPELELSAEDIPVGSSRISQGKHMVGISQTVPFPGKKRLDGEIGDADVMSGDAQWRLHRAELAREVKICYFQVLAAERSAQVAADLVRLAESSAEAARKRTDAGDTSVQEQLRAEIQMEQARTGQADAQKEVIEARQDLVVLLGVPAMRAVVLSGIPDEAAEPAVLSQGPDVWLARHPAMVVARAKCKLAESTARRAGLEAYADPKIGVSGGRDETTDENLMELRLSIPLPFFDRGKGRIREGKALVREAEAELDATEQKLLGCWRAAVARFRTAAAQVKAQRERVLPKSEEALRLVRAGFEQGKFGFIDLLDTQRMAAEVRLIHQKKLLDLNLARADLEAFADPSGFTNE